MRTNPGFVLVAAALMTGCGGGAVPDAQSQTVCCRTLRRRLLPPP